jgi:TonB family protein
MNDQRLGIVTSLVVHAGILLMFFIIPVAQIIPRIQTIQVRFEQPSGSSELKDIEPTAAEKSKGKQYQRNMDQKTLAKPLWKHRETLPQDIVFEQHPSNPQKAVIPDEKPGIAIGQNTGNRQAAATQNPNTTRAGMPGALKSEQQGITESNFGMTGAPAFLHRELPVYPIMAKRLGKEGKVVLKLLIDSAGQLRDIEVVEHAGFGFTEAAVEAAERSTYMPALRNGEKVTSRALLPVRFQLQ